MPMKPGWGGKQAVCRWGGQSSELSLGATWGPAALRLAPQERGPTLPSGSSRCQDTGHLSPQMMLLWTCRGVSNVWDTPPRQTHQRSYL